MQSAHGRLHVLQVNDHTLPYLTIMMVMMHMIWLDAQDPALGTHQSVPKRDAKLFGQLKQSS